MDGKNIRKISGLKENNLEIDIVWKKKITGRVQYLLYFLKKRVLLL